jgi:citrate lyase subunit beta/citryl-CoA lyase
MERPRTRPIRSLVFVPGSEEKELAEVPQQAADAVVLDMEEPQTPMTEAVRLRTRELVSEFLADADRHPKGHPLYFARLRPASSGHMLRDLQAIAHPALSGILVPKIEGTRDIIAADALVTNVEVEAGLPRGSLLLYPILETAQAIRLAYEIAMASPRIGYMGGAISRFGDIHQALGFRWTREGRETLFLRSKVLADVKAAGIRYPISGMWGGDTDDHEGLRAFGQELRDLGYYGMMLGDGSHVSLVHEIFTPTPEEVTYWKELVALADAALASGSEEALLHGDANRGEGHVIHPAHVGSSRLNLEWARDLGVA